MLPSRSKASFWRDVTPTGALADFRNVFRQAGRNRLLFTAMALATTIGIFATITSESWKGPPPKPRVIFINSWPADRSDAEIRASNIANQQRKDKLAAEQAVREEKVKEIYRTVGRASGMDIDSIERQAREDARKEAEAKEAEARKLLAEHAPAKAPPKAAPQAPIAEQ